MDLIPQYRQTDMAGMYSPHAQKDREGEMEWKGRRVLNESKNGDTFPLLNVSDPQSREMESQCLNS